MRRLLTCLWEASRTLRILPLSGNTPYLSRPITPKPETAKDLAESPSVKISVQSKECLPPVVQEEVGARQKNKTKQKAQLFNSNNRNRTESVMNALPKLYVRWFQWAEFLLLGMTLHTTRTTQQEGVSLPSATRYRSLCGKEQNEMQWHVLRSGTDKSAHRHKKKPQQQKKHPKTNCFCTFTISQAIWKLHTYIMYIWVIWVCSKLVRHVYSVYCNWNIF